mgnify:CR=1 FL=1|tara:strand:- start:90 stop:509 length:420 start_codon:yes stop_codon:yes gene_type:complete
MNNQKSCPVCSGSFITETLSSWICADCGATKESTAKKKDNKLTSDARALGKKDYLKYGYQLEHNPYPAGSRENAAYDAGMTAAFKLNPAFDNERRDRKSQREWYDHLDNKAEERIKAEKLQQEREEKRLRYLKASKGEV